MLRIDWNEVIKSTPATLRAAVIIVLLGLVVMLTTVLSFAVWKGRAFEGFGVKLSEYRDPDVQKCDQLALALPSTSAVNQDALNLISAQISQLLSMHEKYLGLAAGITASGGYSFVADRYRADAQSANDKASDLRNEQTNIINSRAEIVKAIGANCTKAPKT